MDTRKPYLGIVSTFPSLTAENTQDVLNDVGPASDPRLSQDQVTFVQMVINLVGQQGQFDKEGCQYQDMSPDGDCCLGCVFYNGSGDCDIVNEQVDPMGVCRFNICPSADMEDESCPTM